MSRIKKLPDRVANQIAAGEVVERPASVVKELLENAVDAGAKRIRVDIEDGGTGLIAVTDDGRGMGRDDAELCLERHATSKIEQAADLEGVTTFGFRGEALPSIASVSRFVLTSRIDDEDEGTRVEIDGGREKRVSAAGAPPGTRIEVRDLFYNVPARRKFLKRPATEMSHITSAVERVALAHPELAIRLNNDGRVALDVPPASPTDQRGWLARILGKRVAQHLYPIEPDDDGVPGVSVRGWVGAPELTERTTRGLSCFVNGRFVRDRTMQHAIADAYRTLMERGRHPVVVLWLDVEPGGVDVNVHPQKTEVRFANSGLVHRAITRAVGRTLAGQPWVSGLGLAPQSGLSSVLRPSAPGASSSAAGSGRTALGGPVQARGHFAGGVPRTERTAGTGGRSYALDDVGAGLDEHRARIANAVAARAPGATDKNGWITKDADPGWSFEPSAPVAAPRPGGATQFAALRPVGQVLGTYLVCQGPDRMVLVDQHAAHERIAFSRMRTQHRAGRVEVQPLLVPRAIELEERRAAIAKTQGARLATLGFELEPFGAATWMLKSVPTAIGGVDVERLVRDLLDELAEVGQSTPLDELVDTMLSCAACHSVVRAGDRLSTEEIQALLEQMDTIDFGANCPHGRPVYVEWTGDELARLFHRS